MSDSWLLHGWLISSLVMMPFGTQCRADEEQFTLTSMESQVVVSLSAPDGTSGMLPGATRQVLVSVQQHFWEVWTAYPSGTIEIRNATTVPLSTGLSFSASGGGVVSPAIGSSDASGNASATLTLGSDASTLTVDASYGAGSVATGSISFSAPDPEVWTKVADQSLLSASLSTGGSIGGVPASETRSVRVHAEHSTWSVYTSNHGNTKTDDYVSSPAIGAQITWSASGDGGITTGTSSAVADDAGNADVTFTMGAGASTVRADVTYGTSTATSATLDFSPAPVVETWVLDHQTPWLVSDVTLSSSAGNDGLAPGATTTVTATVTRSSHEVWLSSQGRYENRNETTIPADGEPLAILLDQGDGTPSTTTVTTGTDGHASFSFTMGVDVSALRVNAGWDPAAGLPLASGTLEFYPFVEVWNYVRTETVRTVSLDADGPVGDLFPNATRQLTAQVLDTTREVWVSNAGNVDYRNMQSVAVADTSVTFSVLPGGGGSVSASGATTGESGLATVGFTMGTASATVRADVVDADGVTRSGTIGLGAHVEVFTLQSNECTISTMVTADGTTTALPPGTTRGLTARVHFESWQVMIGDMGSTRIENYATGAAQNASVSFSVESGDGSVTSVATTADENGNAFATFTMSSQDTRVRADAGYATATSAGSLDFTVDPWVKVGEDSSVSVSLSNTNSTVTADVSYETWDVFQHVSTGVLKNVNTGSGPAGGASVGFSSDGGVTVGSGSATTGIDGKASTSYGFSGTGGNIYVSATFVSKTATASAYFSQPPQPVQQPTQQPVAQPMQQPTQPPPLTINTSSLDGVEDQPYSGSMSASGGNGSYTWSGSLGGGLTLASDGSISGTPSSPGSFTGNVTVTSGSQSESKTVPIMISAKTPDPDPDPDPNPQPLPANHFKMGFAGDYPITLASTNKKIDADQKTYILGPAAAETDRCDMVVYRGGSDMTIFFKVNVNFSTGNAGATATMDVQVKRLGAAIASRPNAAVLTVGDNAIAVDALTIPGSAVIGSGPGAHREALELTATVHYGDQHDQITLGSVDYRLFVTQNAPNEPVIYDRALELFRSAYDLVTAGAFPTVPRALTSVMDDSFVYSAPLQNWDSFQERLNASSLACLDHVVAMQEVLRTFGMSDGSRVSMWGGRLGPSERNMVYDDWWFFRDNKCSIKHASGGDEVRPDEDEYLRHELLLIDGVYCDPSYGSTYNNLAAAKSQGTALWNYYNPQDPGVVVRVEDAMNYDLSTWVERERDGP